MSDLLTFHTDLVQNVRLQAEEEGNEETLSHGFTEYVLDLLSDAGEAEDPITALYGLQKMHASGMDWDAERGLLTVFGTEFLAGVEISTLTKADLVPLLKRMRQFAIRSSQDLDTQVEESTLVHDVVLEIKSIWKEVRQVRLIVLTNALLRTSVPDMEPIHDVDVLVEVWDIDRIFKLVSSGSAQEPVAVDLRDFDCAGLPFLGPNGASEEYSSYLVVAPGSLLADVYGRYGPRLLELNVRSFLQTRGKINKGIQQTLKKEPGRFLAYNNGLSLTASDLNIEQTPQGPVIRSLYDVQIVNGGQTTASLYFAATNQRVDLSGVEVQLKVTVVSPEVREELAPRISEYSNSQNPVRMADFSANDAFHVALEKLSRSVWAPGQKGTSQMTRWFFERARGQYADAMARERTPAAQRRFRTEHPPQQKLLKTDIAKYEHAWAQLPHLVSLGAEKNFREFLQRRKEQNANLVPDELYFQRLVAKAILWRRSESIVTKLHLGGYRAATVAYTLALISHRTAQRIDLLRIWQAQDLSQDLAGAVEELAPRVYATILETAGSRNVTEWAKKKDCWEAVQSVEWSPPESLMSLAVRDTGAKKTAATPDEAVPKSSEEAEALAAVSAHEANTWFNMSSWAKETGNLAPWQRSLAFSIGRAISSGRNVSVKQAIHGRKMLEEVQRLGFSLDHGD